MIEVGQLYEITPEWVNDKGNAKAGGMMPQLKAGALFEVIELHTVANLEMGQVTAIRFIETNETFFIDNSPISHYWWCFFTQKEVNLGFIKLKGIMQ